MEQQDYSSRYNKLEEMKSCIGSEIGLTEWHRIDQEKINQFAEATEDHQWIHTDPALAAIHSPYGTTIAHGFLILSLVPKFIYEVYKVEDVIMGVNYGMEKVRFPNATPVNSEVRARVSLKDFEEIDHGAMLIMNIVVEIKGEEKPACVVEFIALALTGQMEDI